MKLNIITILIFTMLLSIGVSTKSVAQDWRWHRYESCRHGMDTAFEKNFEHCGRWGCAPRRFYRRMMWCGDTAMCSKWCGRPYRYGRSWWSAPEKWEPTDAKNWKDADANFDKYHKDMEEKWKNYMEDMKKEEEKFHEHWKDDHKWGDDYGWRWHRRWHQRDYYRGGGY